MKIKIKNQKLKTKQKNKYIWYSYSVLFWTTNIFDIPIWSSVGIWIYLIFLFGKILNKYALNYTQAAEILGHLHNMNQNLFEIYFWGEGVIKSLYLYFWYLHLAEFLRMNIIFDIQIYLILVFGQVARHEYIWYLYSVSCLDMNIFDIFIQ